MILGYIIHSYTSYFEYFFTVRKLYLCIVRLTYKIKTERNNIMIFSTTPTLEGHPIREYRGVVTGETIIGANFLKDFMAGIRDFFGGRSGSYEKVLREAKDSAMREMAERAENMGCNAIVGIDLDYETVGESGSMLMVTCSGTAVVI